MRNEAKWRLAGHRNIAIPLSFHPNLTIDEVFLFPDGDRLLEAVDGLARGIECRAAVRRRDHHCDAGFADQHPAQAMDDCNTSNCILCSNFQPEIQHYLESHPGIAFVIEAT